MTTRWREFSHDHLVGIAVGIGVDCAQGVCSRLPELLLLLGIGCPTKDINFAELGVDEETVLRWRRQDQLARARAELWNVRWSDRWDNQARTFVHGKLIGHPHGLDYPPDVVAEALGVSEADLLARLQGSEPPFPERALDGPATPVIVKYPPPPGVATICAKPPGDCGPEGKPDEQK